MALPVLRMDFAPPKSIAISAISGLGGAFQIGSCRKRSQHLKDMINILINGEFWHFTLLWFFQCPKMCPFYIKYFRSNLCSVRLWLKFVSWPFLFFHAGKLQVLLFAGGREPMRHDTDHEVAALQVPHICESLIFLETASLDNQFQLKDSFIVFFRFHVLCASRTFSDKKAPFTISSEPAAWAVRPMRVFHTVASRSFASWGKGTRLPRCADLVAGFFCQMLMMLWLQSQCINSVQFIGSLPTVMHISHFLHIKSIHILHYQQWDLKTVWTKAQPGKWPVQPLLSAPNRKYWASQYAAQPNIFATCQVV